MSGSLIEALRSVPLKEWDAFFNARVMAKAMQIESTANEELPALKNEIRAIREMQALFAQKREGHE